jgi:ABC-type uncharacterized transport system substrate-binding protein
MRWLLQERGRNADRALIARVRAAAQPRTYTAYILTTIPIVMFVGADVVEMGLVASLAHPGGNITGSTFFYSDLMAKRLELLKTIAPSTTSAAVFVLKDNPANAILLEKMGETAKALNIALLPVKISGLQEILEALSSFSDAKVDGVVVSDTARILVHAQAIAAFATKNGLPAVGPSEFPQSGGLVGYGVDFLSLFHRAAAFVDRILKGEKPADMPIERATTFKLVLNLKTANALGLTVPPILLATADEAIE